MKPKTVYAWALWIKKYGRWVPVQGEPNLPWLYPSRRAAYKASLKRHDRPVRVKIVVIR